ncbi:high-affinity branched-chain amino acid transport ATP-binding protein LivF [Variibacter gotjawalensis]|uniref:High-affinity branched-chain amino acid transport ATP-binding protein LivF n=1 Tax=Variibacter gotjawalensis TaxID=1333996 RepID=A0A0S3PRI9_9BRAD|nr:ABC transporter ATP-binding protein [Variibacter gotjawalensis]NIK48849.1 branched-chain amino acid transport system ATP-binding protein [Variibacter gotjawalensis]RZS50709.1 branched-chain amino acid transport system ATP-binding protein [Variibacter gotjawalensis]BAT58543.1 high-affinity branched-chain amino acid transport ATP-binding protein LivF [Variibacter gotjawalensis]
MADNVLTLNNIEVVYDFVSLAIKGVSLHVPQGGMVALLGANGAGKSTTLKSISGLLAAERGEVRRGDVRFLDHDLRALPPQERVRLGVAHVLEGRRVFEHLTPDENLIAASAIRSRHDVARNKERVYTYFPRLYERRTSQAGYLSGGEQQMLAIGRALMTQPKLLMLDEPSLGLAPFLVAEIFQIIRSINKEEGLSVLLVEQNAVAALEIVSHGYLIESGRIVMHDSAEALKKNPDIQEFYLGGTKAKNFHDIKHYRRRKRWLT